MPTRERRAKSLGIPVEDLPDGRGRHHNGPKGSGHHRWSLGVTTDKMGYIKVQVGRSHPLADPNGYALLHHVVYFSRLGALNAPLREHEAIHHDDEDKQNNKIENLARMTDSQHSLVHAKRRASRGLLDGVEWHQRPLHEPPR